MDCIVIRNQEDKNAICEWVVDFLKGMPNEKVPFIPPFENGKFMVESDGFSIWFKCLEDGEVTFRVYSVDGSKMPLFSFEYNYSTQQVKNKQFNSSLYDISRVSELESKSQYCLRLAMLWFSVMLLATYYHPEFESRKIVTAEKARAGKRAKNRKKSARTLYTRSYVIDAEMVGKIQRKTKQRANPSHEFSVRGHYRHYKSGKTVWIRPHIRCKGKGKATDRTYIAKL
jgi:hypothetical protein